MPTEFLTARKSQGASEDTSARTSARAEIRMGRMATESGIIWVTTVFMVIFHLGLIAAFSMTWLRCISKHFTSPLKSAPPSAPSNISSD